MTARRLYIRDFNLVLAVGAAVCALAVSTSAAAQAQDAAVSQQSLQVDIPAGNMSDALIELGRLAKVQIGFLPARVSGLKSPAVHGSMSVEQALTRILDSSGLRFQRLRSGSYLVSGPSAANLAKARRLAQDIAADRGFVNGESNIPDILVTGRRDWTLDTDIRRTENEAQPYRVFTRDQILNSGSQSLDDFFRDNLGQLTTVRTAAQGGGVTGRDSFLSLRGLGADSTLILVDGRRYAEPNNGVTGAFLQSSIAGIPLEQIERIEVLASSAAGQYGSNAIGGVINIILRRDYHGVEVSGYVGGSTEGDAMERRLNASATIPVLPKTSLTLTASWKKSDPLYSKDRPFVNDSLATIARNSPGYLAASSLYAYGTTPNIRATNGTNLVLKPQYAVNGVTALGSPLTYVPTGYQGVSINGAAPLLANAGQFNINPPPTSSSGLNYGDFVPLLTASEVINAGASTRSEVTPWLTLYGSVNYSKVSSNNFTSPVPDLITLAANSPYNPFTTSIDVTYPSKVPLEPTHSSSSNLQFLGGIIAKLPWNWQANLDLNTSTSSSRSDAGQQVLSSDFYNTYLRVPALDVLKDTLAYPINWQFSTDPTVGQRAPSKASYTSYTLKLAGPVGFARLWGGKPVVTLVGDIQRQWLGDSIAYNDAPAQSSISFSPARSLNTKSVYAEVVLPVIGADNHVPLIHGFELRLSGRYDAYEGVGAATTVQCVNSHPGRLTDAERNSPCPAPGTTVPYATVRNNSANPVVAAKWEVTPDIALRGTYSSGYTPPQLNNVISNPGLVVTAIPALGVPGFNSAVSVNARDPLRGNELIGTPVFGVLRLVNGVTGGNPNVDPQRSTSWSFGTIITPRVIPGLTLRADWTRIVIRNAYFNPQSLLSATTPDAQTALNDFMAAYPSRFMRAAPAPGDPYGVGPITYIDATTANLSQNTSEAIDFSGNYVTRLGKGTLSINANGTLMLKLTSRLTASSPLRDVTGVVTSTDIYGTGDNLKFRGVANATYSTDNWSIGARVRYFSGYYVNIAHTYVATLGSNRVPGQAYFDIFGSIRVLKHTEFRTGINNLFNKVPPVDTTRTSGYAPNGDPRLRNFFVNLTQRF